MKTYTKRICKECGNEYQPSGPAQKVCLDCKPALWKRTASKGLRAYLVRKGVQVGVGKGGLQKFKTGKNSSSYRHGISHFVKASKVARQTIRYCERCSKDLINAGLYQWALHHRDHDRTNNCDENYELLCKRCHQLEHECVLAFSKVQRPSLTGVEDSVFEAHSKLPEEEAA